MAKKSKSGADRQISILKAYQSVFSGPLGDAVLKDLMANHGMLSAHPADPHQMLLKEGERLVVLRILKKLNINVGELRERIEEYEREMAE